MKIGVFATFMSPLATPQMIRDFGRRAEDIGLDSIWMGEHVALFDKNTFGYPGSKDGRIPVPPRRRNAGGRRHLRVPGGRDEQAASRHRRRARSAAQSDLHREGSRARSIGCRMDGSISASASAGTRRRSRPAAIAGKTAARAATSSWRSCNGCGREPVVDYRGKVGEVRRLAGWIRSRSRNRTCRSSSAATSRRPCVGPCASAPAGTASIAIQPARKRCSTNSMRRLGKPVESAARSSRSSLHRPSMPMDAMQEYAEVGVDRLVVNLGSQRPERIDQRLVEIDKLVKTIR